MNIDKERELFEHTWSKLGNTVGPSRGDGYSLRSTDDAFDGWNARAALLPSVDAIALALLDSMDDLPYEKRLSIASQDKAAQSIRKLLEDLK